MRWWGCSNSLCVASPHAPRGGGGGGGGGERSNNKTGPVSLEY